MDVEILVPLGFFAMIAYIVKLISDNRLRRKVLNSAASDQMADTLLSRQWAEPSTRTALKWGLILLALGGGVLVVDVIAIGFESPLAYAILLLATGAALLGFYAIEREQDGATEPERVAGTPESGADVSEPIHDPDV